jgi:signal peptidase II
MKKLLYLLVPAALLFGIDQGTKAWIIDNILLRRNIPVIPQLFRLTYVQNPGAAWGIMAESSIRMPFFIVTTSLALLVILLYVSRVPREHLHLVAAMGSILGGAAGNFLDRLRFQAVTDWIEFYWGFDPIKGWLIQIFRTNRWPAFNIADVAIVAGLFVILYDMFVLEPRRQKLAGNGAEAGSEATSGEAST